MSQPLIDRSLSQSSTAMRIIELSGMAIAFTIQLSIGITFFKMRHSQNGRELTCIFVASYVSACAATTVYFVYNVLLLISVPHQQIMYYIWWMFDDFFSYSLLATLILRLHITFRDSMFKMSKNRIVIFAFIFIVLFISSIVHVVSVAVVYDGYEGIGWSERWILSLSASFVSLLFYVIGSILAVTYFIGNLSKLAKMQSNSERVVSADAESISLNARQIKLLTLAAKFIVLFLVAIISTIFAVILISAVSWKMAGLFYSWDLCLNLVCLYLQFSFADEQYRKYCRRLDTRCRAMVLTRSKKAIHIQSLDQKQTNIIPLDGGINGQGNSTKANQSDIELR